MKTMRCPWCGSTAKVVDNRWECGFCGNFGRLTGGVNAAWLSGMLERLEEGAGAVIEGMHALFGETHETNQRIWQLVVFRIARPLIYPQNRTEDNLHLLRAFFGRYSVCTAAEVLAAAKSGTEPFAEEYRLTEKLLGSFWTDLFARFPGYGPGETLPDAVEDLLRGAAAVESVFSGEDEDALLRRYREVLRRHWLRWADSHRDAAAAETALRRGDHAGYPRMAEDLLIASFPWLADGLTPEELYSMDLFALLERTAKKDPAKVVILWRRLLEAAAPNLGRETCAEFMLDELPEYFRQDTVAMERLLEAMKTDDALARRVFQSAWAGPFQEDLLDTCDWMGEPELRARLLGLLKENPYPHEPIKGET